MVDLVGVGFGRGIWCWVLCLFARQRVARGQALQFGDFGVQTVAPSSMMPSLSCAGPSGPSFVEALTSVSAACHAQRCAAESAAEASMLCVLRRTRMTLPSTMGWGWRSAMEVIAPAVYRPTPGSLAMAVWSVGMWPWCSEVMARAAAWRFLALR